MKILRLIFGISLLAFGCGFCLFIFVPNLVVTSIIPQMPFGGDQLEAWQLGVPQNSEAVPGGGQGDTNPSPAGSSHVPHVGYRSADARPPSGIPLWAPVTHYSKTYDKALLGCRYHDPNYTTHTGSDFPANEGNSVHTTMAGQVVWASFNGPWGNLVAVENGDYQTWFAHLSRIDVVVGQLVNDGDVVGLVGTTGHSTGNHVHYGVKVFANDTDAFGSWHNPEEFFSLNDVILIGCG